MSNALSNTRTYDVHAAPARRLSTETKASVKTSELVAYVVIVIGVLAASSPSAT